MVLLLEPLFFIILLAACLKMEHCLWENSFICLNILTQTQQPAEQDNCRISTDGEVFPVGPYLCWCNGARCQHVVGAIGCSKLWQFIRLYQISKSQVDHQCHSFCFTGRAPASSHHWWGPNISPSRFRADGASLEQVPPHSQPQQPPYPLRGKFSSYWKDQTNSMLQKVYSCFKMHFSNGRFPPTSRPVKKTPLFSAGVQLLPAQSESSTLRHQARAGKS